MQISLGDKGPGLLAWNGLGESWICWRYPYPRAVLCLLILESSELFGPDTQFELAFYEPELCEFAEVDISCSTLRENGDVQILVKVQLLPVPCPLQI